MKDMNELDKTASSEAVNPCKVSEETENEKACVETESPALDIAEAADTAVEDTDVCVEEESPAMDLAEAADDTSESDNINRRVHQLSKDELVAEMRAIVEDNRMESHREVTALKQAFFSIKNKENLEALNAYIDAGNDPATYASTVDEAENEFKRLYTEFKERRAAFLLEDETRRKENLEKKQAIVAKLNEISEDIDNVNMKFPEFQQLQQEFKDIKEIPAGAENEIWKSFQTAVEKFYDHLKMNKELRDLDFKKNLEAKKVLIAEAKKLEEMTDPVAAFRRLQSLHEEWREIGPVAKEIRESLWDEFKEASTVVNRRHQEYFEKRKAEEQANETGKTEICDEMDAIDLSQLTSFNAWNEMTDKVIALQKRWKEFGYASKKANNLLYARFRKACDEFFNAKTEYFQKAKDELNSNLEKKTALCEKAEGLKEETDLKKAIAEVVKLQNEWKKIGSVPRKVSDAIWQRFQTACNYFFDQRKKMEGERRSVENENLAAKREVIAALKELPLDGDRHEVIGKVKELQARWQEIGFVPFKIKDKIYAEYREICDNLYNSYEAKASSARISRFRERITDMKEGGQKLDQERDKLMRALEARRNELKTIENNMGFFNVKSSAGNSMVKEMERKIARLKEDIEQIKEKIKMIDADK